jgi:hypothetical protein
MTHLAQLVDHPPFRRIGFGTVARRILHHRQQAFHPGPQVRMTIQALQQHPVAVSGEHGNLLGRYQ